MDARSRRGGLGCGGAVGLGGAAALLIGVIAIGHAIFGQIKGAASTVLVFAEVAVCVILASVALGMLGLLAYRGQLARLHLAERRAQLEQLARQAAPTVRAEMLEGGAEAVPHGVTRRDASLPRSPSRELNSPVIQAKRGYGAIGNVVPLQTGDGRDE